MSSHIASRRLAFFSLTVSALLLSACGGGLDGSALLADTTGLEQAQASNRTFTVNGVTFSGTACAREGGVCDFSGTRRVAYGSKSTFVVMSLAGPAQCNNTTFGDPAPGSGKKCYLEIESTPPPTTTVDRSLTLDWVAPTTNDDGTPLTDLAGYRVYYGNSPGAYSNTIAVSSPTTLSYRFDNLPSGTYYAIVKAVNSAAVESNASPELSKSIQ